MEGSFAMPANSLYGSDERPTRHAAVVDSSALAIEIKKVYREKTSGKILCPSIQPFFKGFEEIFPLIPKIGYDKFILGYTQVKDAKLVVVKGELWCTNPNYEKLLKKVEGVVTNLNDIIFYLKHAKHIDSAAIGDFFTGSAAALKDRGGVHLLEVPEHIDLVLSRLNVYNAAGIGKYHSIDDIEL